MQSLTRQVASRMPARHDRTGRFVSGLVKDPGRFFGLPMLITAEPGALETANGAQTLETLVGIVSRFSDNLSVQLPEPHGGLARRMEELAAAAGSPPPCPASQPEVAISVGGEPAGGKFNIGASSSGWAARVSCATGVAPLRGMPNPVGAMGAACLASAEAFKRLAEVCGCAEARIRKHPRELTFSFLDYTFSDADADFPAGVRIGDVLLVGAGAVGSAFAYAASQAGIRGTIEAVDPDIVSETDLNRCLPFFRSDVDRPKAEVIRRLSSDRLEVRGRVARYGGESRRDPVVVSAVDNHDARFAIQHDLPRTLLHGATGGSVAAVSSVKLLDNACFCCMFERGAGREAAISRQTGIPEKEVREAMDGGAFTQDHLRRMRGLGLRSAGLEGMVGRPFSKVYAEICGTLPPVSGGPAPTVPFVSFFSGLALLAELVKASCPELREFPMVRRPDFMQIDLFSPAGYNLARRVKNSRCAMRCSDAGVRSAYARKWGLDPGAGAA